MPTRPGRIAAIHHSRAELTVGLAIGGETGVTARSWVDHVFNPPTPTLPHEGEGVKRKLSDLFSDPLPPRGGGLGWGGRVAPGETVVTTAGHPLWKLGRGWIAAGELRPGDLVATRSGSAIVEAVEVRPGAEVWNLEIADGATYQVGQLGVIAHDLAPIEEIVGGSTRNDR